MTANFQRIALTAFLTLAISSLGFSQAAGPTGGGLQGGQAAGQGAGKDRKAGAKRAGEMLEKEVWSKLDPPLSASQRAELKRIDAKTKSSMQELRAKAKNGDRKSWKAEVDKVQQERRESIRALLSPAQERSFAALMKVAQEKAKRNRGKDGKGRA